MHYASRTPLGTRANGFTVLEVMVAITIFGLVSSAIFHLLLQTDRLRGRAYFVESAVRIAANEGERLRSSTKTTLTVADSSFTETVAGRTFIVERRIIETDAAPSFTPRALEPVMVEIIIADPAVESPATQPVRFKLLLGQDTP